MKRFGVVLLVLVMALAALASLAGCGSSSANKSSAKTYMNEGDAKYDAAVKSYGKLTALQTQLMTAKGETLGTLVKQMEEEAANMQVLLGEAKTQYNMILPLTGVEDYVTYANMQLDVITMYGDLLAAANAMITKYLPIIQAGTLDVMTLLSGPEFQNITRIGDDIEAQEIENKSFRSEKKLAQ